MPLTPWPAAAMRLKLSYHGLDDGDVAKFSGERGGIHASVTCRSEEGAYRWHAVLLHDRFPRGLAISDADRTEAAADVITGDETFDRRIRVLSGGAGALALLKREVRRRMLELFAETNVVIGKARLEMDEVTATPEAIGVARHVESALWIARRLAHPMTKVGLIDNVLDDPDPEVKLVNLRMLARIDPDALQRLPQETNGIDLSRLIERARLEARAAGRLSLAEEEGGEVSIAEEGGLSLRPKR
jgi:hypothetical protein